MQLDDHVMLVFEYPERSDQAVVTATGSATQEILEIRVVAFDELIEVLLTDH
jgi:uncharacterized protein YfaT (DUF1175 family)